MWGLEGHNRARVPALLSASGSAVVWRASTICSLCRKHTCFTMPSHHDGLDPSATATKIKLSFLKLLLSGVMAVSVVEQSFGTL